MEHYLFNQLDFVRAQVLKAVEGISEETADRIPDGFRNSIRWQLGHIYVVLERFAFQFTGRAGHMPEGFKELFEFKTSPLTAPPGLAVPSLPELTALLKEQPARIRREYASGLDAEVTPYTTSAGMKLESLAELLSFNLYHEGMHFSVIKQYKVLLAQ